MLNEPVGNEHQRLQVDCDRLGNILSLLTPNPMNGTQQPRVIDKPSAREAIWVQVRLKAHKHGQNRVGISKIDLNLSEIRVLCGKHPACNPDDLKSLF
jgi:hypothetical protein